MFMTVEDALDIVYQLAAQNTLDPRDTDQELQAEAERQQTALNVIHDFQVNVSSEGRLDPELREPPKGSNFTTLLVAYLFDSKEQFKMFDEAEGEARHTVDGETGGVIALLEWQRQSGFPTNADFTKFRNEVAFELGDIPFVDIEEK